MEKRAANPARGKGARRRGTTIDDVRRLALLLPGTVEKPSYGTPGFRAKNKLYARVLGADAIVVRTDLEFRDAIVASKPSIFSVTDHYRHHPWVIVSLPAIGEAALRDVLAEAWRLVASP